MAYFCNKPLFVCLTHMMSPSSHPHSYWRDTTLTYLQWLDIWAPISKLPILPEFNVIPTSLHQQKLLPYSFLEIKKKERRCRSTIVFQWNMLYVVCGSFCYQAWISKLQKGLKKGLPHTIKHPNYFNSTCALVSLCHSLLTVWKPLYAKIFHTISLCA